MEGVIAVTIPIFITLVIGLVISVTVYFRSREKQMLIEKGIPPEEIKEFLRERREKDPNGWLKIGILCIFFGMGASSAGYFGEYYDNGPLAAFSFFLFTGIGFITVYFVSKKLESGK